MRISAIFYGQCKDGRRFRGCSILHLVKAGRDDFCETKTRKKNQKSRRKKKRRSQIGTDRDGHVEMNRRRKTEVITENVAERGYHDAYAASASETYDYVGGRQLTEVLGTAEGCLVQKQKSSFRLDIVVFRSCEAAIVVLPCIVYCKRQNCSSQIVSFNSTIPNLWGSWAGPHREEDRHQVVVHKRS